MQKQSAVGKDSCLLLIAHRLSAKDVLSLPPDCLLPLDGIYVQDKATNRRHHHLITSLDPGNPS